MAEKLPTKSFQIKCSCGALQGSADVVPADGNSRLSCYCDDCQSFVHFLGRAAEVLDGNGGTEVYQMAPVRVQIGHGSEHLGCVRLRPKGLLRWYATCCNTPLGNTVATQQVPFVGLVTACIDQTAIGESLDALLGPPKKGVHGRFAKGDRSGLNAYEKAPLGMIFSALGKILMRRLRGAHKPSPFFDGETGAPVAEPKVLSEAELREVEGRRDSWVEGRL
ncbi:hypothetical protein FKG94_13790 [Exilibacterium tricleocarpae]|uniref:CENP-V/GFA domain-containing protein n=1 Tax=Exilibacterium tricleocarpae TaxID=2591008 RepID=A0A545TLU0_9GAMM|nr:DUF6151 family protein [Exilibacterium tricleocarpae]TQV78146.1 hypothetical protein FKG94_13790 [Exilibacterium tricleocarpae]